MAGCASQRTGQGSRFYRIDAGSGATVELPLAADGKRGDPRWVDFVDPYTARSDLIAFAACHDGDIAALTAAPVRAFLGEIAGQAPATRKRKRAAVASFCKWAVRHELLGASPMDRHDDDHLAGCGVERNSQRPGGGPAAGRQQ